MCELLAMSSRLPTNVNHSLLEFARHGGETGPHADGWGIAYAMGGDFRIIKEPQPAADSDCVRYIQAHHFSSRLVISHIRKASLPRTLSFENTHPFDRELFGRRFLFAHNGHLPGIDTLAAGAPPRFLPLGETDSERAFCLILNRLAQRAGRPEDYRPRLLLDVLTELSPHLRALGKCNFLLSDTEYLIAHGDTSLHSVTRTCTVETQALASADLRISMTHHTPQVASVVATVPLTAEAGWRAFAPGEIRVFSAGSQVTP